MKLEITTNRGEQFGLKLYRDGSATVTVQAAGDWRTAFLSVAQVGQLRDYLVKDPRAPRFVAEPPVYKPDTHVMPWETAPMVPTVREE